MADTLVSTRPRLAHVSPQTGLFRFVRFARKTPIGAASALVILLLILAAVLAGVIAPYDPYATGIADPLLPPGLPHLFGTDQLGRDLFSRVLFGARFSLQVGLIAVGLGTLTGSVIGLASGYFEGTVDLVVQRVMDAIMAFPALILTMAVVAVLGPDLVNVMIAIAIVIMPGVSRVVRGATLGVKHQQFVEAARSLGATDARIIVRHIGPNVLAPIIILISVGMGGAILAETGLSFLGLGAQVPTPSWGLMLSSDGRRFMEQAPWLALFPGLAIVLTVLAFNLLGDALRDLLDPKLRRR